jgi:hypothetical protein
MEVAAGDGFVAAIPESHHEQGVAASTQVPHRRLSALQCAVD